MILFQDFIFPSEYLYSHPDCLYDSSEYRSPDGFAMSDGYILQIFNSASKYLSSS